MHDLKLISFDDPLYKVLAITPFVIWLALALVRKSTRPFYDFIVLGITYGVLLSLTHQILWEASWAGNPPRIGGNLAGAVSPALESVVLRTFAFISSIMTGLVTGITFGLIALSVSKLRPSHKSR